MHQLKPTLLLSLLYHWGSESFRLISTSRAFQLPAVQRNEIYRHHAAADVGDFNDIGADLRRQQLVPDLCIRDEEGGILSALFGSEENRDLFFIYTYGRRVAYFPRSLGCNSTEDQPGLGSKFGNKFICPPISGIDLPSLYLSNEWTSLRKRGSQDMLNKDQMSYQQMTGYIEGGGSIIIPITRDDYIFPIKLQVERALGVKEENGTTMNIYHSGPSAVALNIHYDAYPVFVLQLEGKKEWIIQDDAFGRRLDDITQWRNVTMTEGDLLYIPKGVFHAATTAEGYNTTTHATIGLL
jgi:hypothetical protein